MGTKRKPPLRGHGQRADQAPDAGELRTKRVFVMMSEADVADLEEWANARDMTRSTAVNVLVRGATDPDGTRRRLVLEVLRGLAREGVSAADLLADLAARDREAEALVSAVLGRIDG